MDHVVAVRIVPKQEALEKFKAGLGEAGRKALEGYEDENNPLPDSFEVEVDSPKHRNRVKAAIEKLNETMDSQPIMNVH
jgi:Cell division protein